MDKSDNKGADAAQLRRRAEERSHEIDVERPPLAEPDTKRLLHELEVHQIELELQNSELRQAREETEELLEQYTELYDFAPVGYFTIDPDGILRASNLAGASLLGLERSRLLGRSLLTFISAEGRPAFVSFLGKVMAGRGVKEEVDLELAPRQDGSPPLFVRIEGVAGATGSGCRIAVLDITKHRQIEQELGRYREHLEWLVGERTRSLEAEIAERRRAELEIKELNASLENRVAERTSELQATIRDLETFSYTISHDLRTPLRSINSFATVLMEDFSEALNDEGKSLLNSIIKRTVNMGTLIDDLLAFSKNSRQQLTVQPIDMAKLARELVDKQLSEKGQGSAVEFKIAKLPQARGDRSLIAQVLENLIANAVKFSAKVEHPVVELGSLAQGNENVYFVKDNGIGFDMKYAGAIFGVFRRLHDSGEFEGTGVGLAIVEQIVTKHGGKVWAESTPGHGATFYFTLPRSEERHAEP